MAIKVQIEKVGIPVEFGEVELFFSTSEDNLKRLFELKDGRNEEIEALERQWKELQSTKDITSETLNETLDNAKKAVKALYDLIFDEGSFEKVYTAYPSSITLFEGFMQIIAELPQEIEEYNKRVEKKQQNKIAKYRKKKK